MRPSHVARTLLMVSWLLVTSALSAAEVKEVAYRSGDETVHGLVFVPSGKGPFPGLLAIHAVFGLDEWTKEQASKLADAGYVVLALDFYRGKVARTLDDGVKLSRAVPMRAARSSGGTSAVMDATHGFLHSSTGEFTTIDFSAAVPTVAQGINSRGEIVGFYRSTEQELTHGFLRATNGELTTLDHPAATKSPCLFLPAGGTNAGGINDRGDIVGGYCDGEGKLRGYLFRGGTRAPTGSFMFTCSTPPS